jgi:LCP family protein required for cell wall assembly
MAKGRDRTPDEPTPNRRTYSKRELANQQRLMELGDAVDERSGVKRQRRRGRRGHVRRNVIISAVVLIGLLVGVVGGGYLYADWRFTQIPKITVKGEVKAISGQPFNILMIGSDSRAGLTGLLARQTGAATGSVVGQRSDSVKIVHVDPTAGTISILSIPRDTMVTLLAHQSLYGQFNRINVNFRYGPSLLAQTITANFGIPIHQTIVVTFIGLINAADALGGVYLNFPYPSRDPYSDLVITHPGCQLIKGSQALHLSRSRHFYYNVKGISTWPGNNATYSQLTNLGWDYDGTSDFGRIDRQSAFLRAIVNQAKKLYNPLTINSFLSKLPQGITLDSNFTLSELIGLAVRFHSLSSNDLFTYTLPWLAATIPNLHDVLFVDQPYAQQQLVSIFGRQLLSPSNPPPNEALQTPLPPKVSVTTTTTTTLATKTSGQKKPPVTKPAVNPTLAVPAYDPVPCTPK